VSVEAQPLRVLLCDDSAVARAALARILETDPALRVVARARDGMEALHAVQRGGLDVAVLDIDMPVMDGLTALPLLLKADPGLRVIVASTLTTRGASAAMQAMRHGAADYLPKPSAGQDRSFAEELLAKVKGHGRLRRRAPAPAPARVPTAVPGILAIGSSTGGPEALAQVFRAFRQPPRLPLLLTQHMPESFIAMLAEHLSRIGPTRVTVAQEGELLAAGQAYIAPGGRHMQVAGGTTPLIGLSDAPAEHFCRPAVDPMLRSVAAAFGPRAVVAVLTGMGQDGAAGAAAVAAAGGRVLAQDEATSVVWGMPGAVVQCGAAHEVLPLPELARRVAQLAGAA
jgi:two-component system, chemotaxis family, protein-glutamate methylesterase/glutaminase